MSEKVSLEDVLHGYAYEAGDENNPDVLDKYVKKYPQFYDELTEFAASRSLLKHSPEAELTEKEEQRYWHMGVEQMHTFLKKKPAAIESLNALAEEQGMNKKAFAAALGVTISLLMYLEKRRLRFASIPSQFIKQIAESVKEKEESVAAYLRGGPELSTQASFKAEGRPRAGAARDFLDVVKEDPGLTDDQRKALLNLE